MGPRPPDLGKWSERLQRTQPLLAFCDTRLAGFLELASGGFELLRHNVIQKNGQVLNNALMQKLLPGYRVASIDQPDDAVWRILLLADPSREQIEKYIYASMLRVLTQISATVGVCVLYPHDNHLAEIKNISVEPASQLRGRGRQASRALWKLHPIR